MSLAVVTNTRWTVWPLMSMPRMAAALASVSSGVSASFTPPALPRPPVFTCAFTTTVCPNRSAAARACAGVVATAPGSTGTPWAAKRSFAWYSYRSTLESPDYGSDGAAGAALVADRGRSRAGLRAGSSGLMPWGLPRGRRRLGAAVELVRPYRPRSRPVSRWPVKSVTDGGEFGHRTGSGLGILRCHVGADPVHDVLGRRARREHLRDAEFGQLRDVLVRDDPAAEHHDVVGAPVGEQLDDLLRRLAQAGVDDLDPGVAQGTRHHLDAPVVAVEARLGDHNTDPATHAILLMSTPRPQVRP